jgi:hypothetical protein
MKITAIFLLAFIGTASANVSDNKAKPTKAEKQVAAFQKLLKAMPGEYTCNNQDYIHTGAGPDIEGTCSVYVKEEDSLIFKCKEPKNGNNPVERKTVEVWKLENPAAPKIVRMVYENSGEHAALVTQNLRRFTDWTGSQKQVNGPDLEVTERTVIELKDGTFQFERSTRKAGVTLYSPATIRFCRK